MGGLVYILGSHGPLQQTILWDWEFLPLPPPPHTDFYSQRFWGFTFRRWIPGLRGLSHFPVFLPAYPHVNVGLSSLLAATLPTPVCQPLPCCLSSLPQLPISTSPTSLDECFFFNSLVIGLPYSLLFWQFSLFLFFKLVVILLLVVWGSEAYLPTPPSWPELQHG